MQLTLINALDCEIETWHSEKQFAIDVLSGLVTLHSGDKTVIRETEEVSK